MFHIRLVNNFNTNEKEKEIPSSFRERNISCVHYDVYHYIDGNNNNKIDLTVYPSYTKLEGITWRITRNLEDLLDDSSLEYVNDIFIMNSDGKTIDRL